MTEPELGGPTSVFRLDPELLDAVVDGETDRQADAALAEQVSTVLPWHAALPTDIAARLTRLVRHLGGDDALLRWLDEHPGRPRVVARAYRLIGLLDQISASPAVVTAVRELRERTPYPPGLEGYLVPDTDSGTLASLAQQIEGLLGDDRPDDAVALSVATIGALRDVVPRAVELDPELRGLEEVLGQLRREIEEAREPGGRASHRETSGAASGVMTEEKWFYCLRHRRVEPFYGCRALDRLGPYPDRETAARALEIAREHTEAADRYDREWWEGEDKDENA
jgi:hypothetical protein